MSLIIRDDASKCRNGRYIIELIYNKIYSLSCACNQGGTFKEIYCIKCLIDHLLYFLETNITLEFYKINRNGFDLV